MKAMKPGSTLVELVTTVALLGILSVACGALLKSQAQLLRHTSERAATAETLRTARGVLHAELRDISAADIRGVGSDSLALRVFRGFGIVCAVSEEDVVLRYRGLRAPDPSKDSLLLIAEERTTTFRLASDRPLCVPRPDEQLITIAPVDPLADGSLVLLFESGSYHIANRALRYRRGTEGRQPLTDELIDDRRSGFSSEPGGFRVLLRSAVRGVDADTYIRLSERGE
jgi:hypothetical protein